jgi:hypothetical protein
LKIGVCVKQVPAKDAPLAIVDGGAWIRESDIGFETNTSLLVQTLQEHAKAVLKLATNNPTKDSEMAKSKVQRLGPTVREY